MSKTSEEIKNNMREAVNNPEENTVVEEVNDEIGKIQESLKDLPEVDILAKAQEWGYKEGGQDKDGNTFTPMEFLSRRPLFSRIHSLQDQHKKDMDGVRSELEDQRKDNKKIAEYMTKENDKLMADLEKAREEALTNLDIDEVRKLDKEIKEVVSAPTVGTYADKDWNAGYKSFLKDNTWYDEYKGLAKAADAIGLEYKAENESCSPKELYTHVAKEIRKEFPERFDKKNPSSNQKVTAANKRATSEKVVNKKKSLNDYDHEEQRVIQNMARATGKTVEEYLNR